MRWKWIVAGLTGFGTGVVMGILMAKVHYDNAYATVVDDIYNECYAEALKEVKSLEEKQEIKKEMDIVKEYKVIANKYDKPDLKDLVVDTEIEIEDDTSEEDYENLEEDLNNSLPKQDKPYLIDESDFSETNLGYTKTDIFYYNQDNIFTDDEDQIIGVEDEILGLYLKTIEPKLRNEDKLYLRNDQLETDFEIYNLKQSYHEIAFETHKERERRITKRKMNQAE